MYTRGWCVLFCFALLTACALAQAQGILEVTGLDGAHDVITPEVWARLPRGRVTAIEHDGREVAFEGVVASEILKRVHTPLGTELRGKSLALYVVAEAADGYRAIYSLTEFDPAFSDRVILIADRRDDQALKHEEGPLRMVVPGDKRPARWVRQLTRISVKRAE
jgi:DMSO/TMAO reductase YedYZ molybdopterin-dependent catalytic subunit